MILKRKEVPLWSLEGESIFHVGNSPLRDKSSQKKIIKVMKKAKKGKDNKNNEKEVRIGKQPFIFSVIGAITSLHLSLGGSLARRPCRRGP